MNELPLDTFLYRFGIRNDAGLSTPRTFGIESWGLPKNVALHYLPIGPQDMGPEADFWPLIGFPRQHYVYHVLEQVGKEGNPRFLPAVNVNNLVRYYYTSHRTVRRVNKLQAALMDKRYPIVYNYAIPPLRYRYLKTPWTRVYRFNNLWETLIANVEEAAKASTRTHLVFFNIPQVLPPRSKFHSVEEAEITAEEMGIPKGYAKDGTVESSSTSFAELFAPVASSLTEILGENAFNELASESFDESSLGWTDSDATISLDGCDCDISFEAWSRVNIGWFPDDDSMRLVDLWRWLGENPENSKLNAISPENYEKVIFVFCAAGRYSLVSMANLHAWKEKNGATAMAPRFHNYMSALSAYLQVDQKDMILETIPESITDKPEVMGIIPSGQEDTSIVESGIQAVTGSVSSVLSNAKIAAVGKRQLSLVEDSSDINDIDNENITEIDDEELPTLPEQRSIRLAVKPEKEKQDPVITVDTSNPLEAGIATKSAELLRKGIISPAEHQRHVKLSKRYKEIKVDGTTLEKQMVLPEKEIWEFKPAEIPDIPVVVDKGMLKSSLINFDRDYVEKVMPHDTVNCVMAVQRAGFAITGFEKEEYTDALSKTIDYRIKVTPVHGKESTLAFQLPKIDRNGKYMINGVRYYQRKLRADKPIRKINTYQVALSTYYGKLFCERSTRKSNSFDNWIANLITNDLLSDNGHIKDAVYGNSYGEKQDVPRMYSAIAQIYLEFKLKGIHFHFNYGAIGKTFPAWKDKPVNPNEVPCGFQGDKVVTMDRNGDLTVAGKKIGNVPSLLGADLNTAPQELCVLRVLGQDIPIGIVLGYLYGINTLSKVIAYPDGQEYPRRRVKGGKRDTAANEFEVVFKDEIWVFPRAGSKQSLIWASLNSWKNQLRTVQVAELNDRENYFPLFTGNGLGFRHLNELGLIEDMFLDPIAIENLRAMGEPTEIKELLVRAVEMLVTDVHKSDLDTSLTLIKGYERMNGAVYKALVDSVRNYRNKPVSVKSALDLNPFEVLTAIQNDPSVSQVEDSNVVHNMKEKENMTYSGTGGRSKLAMVRRTRAFHSTDTGIRSEAGVDSGDVGINMFTPANPNFTSLRGTVESLDPVKASPTQIISSSMLLSPFAEYDDGKRVNFINIQQDHVIATKDSLEYPVKTGYDSVTSHRVDDLFSATAEDDGTVVSIEGKVITVKYKNGKTEAFRIGRRFGKVTGHVVPHDIVTDLKAGQKFTKGTVLIRNSGFFNPDKRVPGQVCQKGGVLPYTALIEKTETWEDSSLISPELAAKMITRVGHHRVIYCKFTDEVHNLVKVGDEVDIDTVLAVVQDVTVAAAGSQDAYDSLNLLSRPTPRAGEEGVVDEITVTYFGDKEDMSPSLRKIADKYDRERGALAKALMQGDAKTGEISSPARIDGVSIDIDMMAIEIFITEERSMSGGDKLVLSNQLKSVAAGEQKGPTETSDELWEGGGTRKVELEFSYRAEEARIVHSSIMGGLSIISQEYIGFKTAQAFFEN